MPKTNIYDDKETRFVDLIHPTIASVKFNYYFKTNVNNTEVTELGQTPVNSVTVNAPAPAIAGTRRPTPLMVTNPKKRISTLCSSSKFATAQASGWRRKSAPTFSNERVQNTAPGVGDRGAVLVTVPVTSLGSNLTFGWFMQYQQFLKITDAERTAMGIKIPQNATEWAGVVLGCNRVRPPRARRVSFTGTNITGASDTTETFYEVGSILPSGWVHSANALEFTI